MQIWVLVLSFALIDPVERSQWAVVILCMAWVALILLVRGEGRGSHSSCW